MDRNETMEPRLEQLWLRRALYTLLAFSLAMWLVTMASGPSSKIDDVIRIEAAKSRYLVGIELQLFKWSCRSIVLHASPADPALAWVRRRGVE